MNILKIHAAVVAVGLLAAVSALAQTAPIQKQQTQEGGPSMQTPCGQPYNGNSSADLNCKQPAQNLAPSSLQAPPSK
jgi:hypothetical protein